MPPLLPAPPNPPPERPALPWHTPLAPCPDEDASRLERIEVTFGMPVLMTQAQQRALNEVIDDITDSPWNQPQGGVHWLAETGSKPNWSQADQRFMGLRVDPDAPASGEPTFDDSVFTFGTCAREFVSDDERKRVQKSREVTQPSRPATPAASVGVGRYTKRPITIEAIRWTGENSREVNDWIPGAILCWSSDHAPCIRTLEGTMRAEVGDWIIKGVKGEFYPVKPDIFEASYQQPPAAARPEDALADCYEQLPPPH